MPYIIAFKIVYFIKQDRITSLINLINLINICHYVRNKLAQTWKTTTMEQRILVILVIDQLNAQIL